MPAERSVRPKREPASRPLKGKTRKAKSPNSDSKAEGGSGSKKPKATRKRKVATAAEPAGKFGPIAGFSVGSTFKNRDECMRSGVHGVGVAGIHGSKNHGAYSICVSGGYEDDIDDGEYLVYTGAGGQQNSYQARSSQINDQSFDHDHNAALKRSSETGQPVRVVRGVNNDSKYAPVEGLRYDGLYKVEKALLEKGLSGRQICSFQLRRIPGQSPILTKWK